MITTCFIISSNENKEHCDKIKKEVKNALHVDKIVNLNIKTKDISIDTLLSLNLIDKNNPNISKNDLNQLVVSKSENRLLTLSEIKEYIEHVQIWQYIARGNEDNVLVIDNRTKIKDPINSLIELKKSIQHLPDFYGILGLCKPESYVFNTKCNDFINYLDVNSKIGNGYIITKTFANTLIKYALPIKSSIHRLLSEISIISKKGYLMKYPILEVNKKKDTGNILVSLPVNNINLLDSNVYIFDEGEESYISNINSVKKTFEHVEHIPSEVLALTRIIVTKKSGIVVNSKIPISKRIFNTIGDTFPQNMHFLGWTEKQLEEPFVFSNILEYVHPKMPKFDCYYVTPVGANLLLQIYNSGKENEINIILSRERIGFAHVVDKL